jgi:hypothetical protein
MDYGDEEELHISEALQVELERILIQRGREAVAAHEDRDSDCADCADYANGVAMPQYRPSWQGGSELVNPVVPKEITTLEASLVAPLMQQNIAQVAAKDDNDKTPAKLMEAWENDKCEEEELTTCYQGYIHNLIVFPSSVIRMLWCDKTKKTTDMQYWDGESLNEDGIEQLIPKEMRDPDAEYEEIDVSSEEVEHSGVKYDVVDPVNFYLVPATARSLETAQGTLERMILTESELLAGIDTYGYKKHRVMKIIAAGSSLSPNEYRERQNDNAGVSETADSIATEREFECFMYFGNLPYLWENGEAKLPPKLWGKKVCAMWCPEHDIVFKLTETPYDEFPYFMDSLFPVANRAYGQGFVQKVMGLADSVTHYSRATEDILDIELNPVFTSGEASWEANKSFEFYPGARFISVDGEPPMEAIPLPQSGLMGLQMVQYMEGQIKDIAAAQGSGELQEKVRKNGEIANMEQAVQTKFNLLKFIAYRNLPKIFRRRALYQLQFGGGSDTAYFEGAEATINEDVFKKAYRFSVAQTDADSSDDAKAFKAQGLAALQQEWIQAKQAMMQGLLMPEDAGLIYTRVTDAAPIYGVREPERIFGKKPEVPQMGAMANPMMAGMAQNPMGQMMAGGSVNGQPAGMGASPGFAG